jgi:hypothetical protein
MVTRQELHELLDRVPDQGLNEARRYLQALKEAGGDPLLSRLLLAPEEDEEITADEEAAVAEAREDTAAGRLFTLEDVKRELGL